MSRKLYLGIDPGKNGGIGFVTESKQWSFNLKEMTDKDIFDALKEVTEHDYTGIFCYIERVSSSPQMGNVSAFTFGAGFGALKMALVATGIAFDQVSPQKWQWEMKCRSGGDKKVTKRRAQELFPDLKITHANADALLIAEFCRRNYA